MTESKSGGIKLAIEGGTPVRTDPLPWELPGAHWIGQEERELLDKVVSSASPFRYYGPDLQGMVDQLEEVFRTRFGRKYALGVNSGSAALHLSLRALGVGPGDEVLVPGYMWVACISAIVRLGAIPRLVDIDQTFCVDPKDLEEKITPHSKVLLLVHMSGAPGRLDRIMKIAREHGLKVLEDCAQAIGSSFKGKPVGSFGDMAIFSFQLNKNMTSGEGGMLVCDDQDLYKQCFAMHDLGYARDDAGRLDTSDENYQMWGIGSRMSELTGAMALAQVRKLDDITGAMRSAKWRIRKQIADIPGLAFRTIVDPDGDSGPFLICIFDDGDTCQKFTEALVAEGIRGCEGSLAFIPMTDWGLHWYFNNASLTNRRSFLPDGFPWTHPANEFARDYDYSHGLLKTADDLASRCSVLTIASCLSDQDVNDIITAFKKVADAVLS